MSAVTENNYTGNNSTTTYSFTFPYLKTSDIKASLDGVATTAFTLPTATTLQFNTAPATGALIKIFRETTVDELTATFYAGSAIKSEDLNENFTQNLYVTQEVNQRYLPTTGGAFTGNIDLGNNRITTLGNPTNPTDAVNKQTLDSSIDTAIESDVLAGTDLSKTASGGQVTINHDVAGADTTINNSNGNVVQDITISAQGHVTSAGSVDLDGRYYTETELDAGQLDNRYYTETELDAGQLDNRYYTETELDAGQLDNRYYTETELDAGALDPLYFRQDSSETISSGQTWSAGDTHVATTAAIDARIIDLVDEVGGFDIVNDEQSFPDTNPGGTTGQAAVLSIKAASTTLTPSGTTVTINNGNLANNANIIITGVPSPIPSGFGFLVESTSTLHTYTFHRLVPKATEVTTVANNATAIAAAGNNTTNINNVYNNEGNINTVATNIGNVNNVGNNIANVNTVANNLTDVSAFADVYRVASSDPSARADGSSLQEGDLYFNTTSDQLKVYNGGSWQGGVTATGNLASLGSNTFTGNQTISGGVTATSFTGDGANLTNLPVDLTQLNATNLTSGTIPDARFPATLPAASGANLTSLPAANLTGTLPAISGANLTNLPSTGGLTGGGTDELFIESDNVMSTDFTTGTNKNYINLLPLAVNATLTVASGSVIQFVSI